jgi:DNA topoisomerase-1
MEEKLDLIAVGEVDQLKYLKSFYSGKKGLKQQVDDQEKSIKPEESRTIHLEGVNGVVDVKVGRFGPYIISHGEGKDEIHASIPEDIAPADLKDSDIDELIEMSKRGPVPIGEHPDTKEPIFCLVGRYGPYLQQGEVTEENPKPRRASLPKGTTPKTIEMEYALKLLSLPRELGNHPETGKPVLSNNGKFGPYIMHDGEFRSLKKEDDVYTVELARALEVLNMPKFGRGGTVVKDFGKVEKIKKSVKIVDGKYGLYVKAGTKNYTLPDELKDIEKVKKLTEAQVLKIIKDAGK